jgi:hypothetical protein
MEEMLRQRWASARFARHQAGQRALSAFWHKVRMGRVEDGTAGVWPDIAIGNASFPSCGRGYTAAPTKAVTHSAEAYFGANHVFGVGEHRTSKTCAACGQCMQDCVSATWTRREIRAVNREAARAEKDNRVLTALADSDGDARAAIDNLGPRTPANAALMSQLTAIALGLPPPLARAPRVARIWRLVRGLKRCSNRHCPDKGGRLRDRDVNAALNLYEAFWALVHGEPRPQHLQRGPHPSDHMVGAERRQFQLRQGRGDGGTLRVRGWAAEPRAADV